MYFVYNPPRQQHLRFTHQNNIFSSTNGNTSPFQGNLPQILGAVGSLTNRVQGAIVTIVNLIPRSSNEIAENSESEFTYIVTDQSYFDDPIIYI